MGEMGQGYLLNLLPLPKYPAKHWYSNMFVRISKYVSWHNYSVTLDDGCLKQTPESLSNDIKIAFSINNLKYIGSIVNMVGPVSDAFHKTQIMNYEDFIDTYNFAVEEQAKKQSLYQVDGIRKRLKLSKDDR